MSALCQKRTSRGITGITSALPPNADIREHHGIYTRRQPTKHKTSSKEKDSEGGNRPTGREGTSLWGL
jgi:hypothetical protein